MSLDSLRKEKETLLRLARYALSYKQRLLLSIITSFIVAGLDLGFVDDDKTCHCRYL